MFKQYDNNEVKLKNATAQAIAKQYIQDIQEKTDLNMLKLPSELRLLLLTCLLMKPLKNNPLKLISENWEKNIDYKVLEEKNSPIDSPYCTLNTKDGRYEHHRLSFQLSDSLKSIKVNKNPENQDASIVTMKDLIKYLSQLGRNPCDSESTENNSKPQMIRHGSAGF